MTKNSGITRREWLKKSAAAAAAVGAAPLAASALPAELAAQELRPNQNTGDEPDRQRRMQWWHAARFGMFIHWGLYSTVGRHEWVMENEAIPVLEYEPLAKRFHPKPNAARDWARLAKAAGQHYMVMTTKHHEGFCNFDTKTTDYNAAKQGPGRDLVREYVEAARAEGMRVGFYYSLMDWHHPDGARCATDEPARQRFVPYIHEQIHELMSNYGKIDVLWYDVAWPLDAKGWESEKMNDMVFKLQPDIIVNNRNKLPGDFSTPEQRIEAEKDTQRAWESCMTLNDSWGYQAADHNWKTPTTVIRNLITCSRQGGNYLLNIGPMPDGSVPPESVKILTEVGNWLSRNGDTVYPSDLTQPSRSNYASFTRKGNTLFMHVHYYPGEYVAICGLQTKVTAARLHVNHQALKFTQDPYRVRITGLPPMNAAPDHPVVTIELDCESVPTQDNIFVRREKPRAGVNVTAS
jgi:alpha-L-fucosidase